MAVSCSSSPADNCNDVSGQICDRLAECNALDTVFSSRELCVSSFNGFFEVAGSDEQACRDTWSESKELDCPAFLAFYSI